MCARACASVGKFDTLVRESDKAIVSLHAAFWESIVQVRP